MKIWKYELDMEKPVQALEMPMNAHILTAQVQGPEKENLVLWARVHPTNVPGIRWIYLLQTGKEVPADKILTYIATVQFWDGDYVLHVWEGLMPDDR